MPFYFLDGGFESIRNKLRNVNRSRTVQIGKALQDNCKVDQKYLVELEEDEGGAERNRGAPD